MPSLVWDRLEDREYETGLDKGVLYLPDGSAVPWNGLTSVIENFNEEATPVYYDGVKINNLVTLGEFAASMKALTYPDEFIELEGAALLRSGLFLKDQKPQLFGLCYRTIVGDSLDSEKGYKIHIIYNVLAVPKDKNYATIQEQIAPVEFEWEITAIPEEILDYHPTAHIIIDTKDIDPELLEELEAILYGGTVSEASLIPLTDLISYLREWYRIKITDNGDGTWTALFKDDDILSFPSSDIFQLLHVNAIYLDEETFVISDAFDLSDVPLIKIFNNSDGTWSATEDEDGLIEVTDGVFQINNANEVIVGTGLYKISDTPQP